ncbi:MAG: 3'-5' exonuclease [Bacteroidia bacterium]
MNFIAIDFETANSTRSSICSVGIAIVENGKLTGSEHIYVKPMPDYYNSINTSIHGISDRHTRNKATFSQQWNVLKKYFHNQTIIAHNAAFDCSVLRYALDSNSIAYPDLDYHCTLMLSKAILPLRAHKLSDVSGHFGIKLDHHHAESDARAAALIALKLIERNNVGSLKELSLGLGFKVGKISGVGGNAYQSFSRK